jgi:tetraacyldisaccharide 4'-kinase
MRAPDFWRRDGALAHALAPLSWAWAAGARARQAGAKPARVGAPVLCVGNLTVGGTGKTPTVLALLDCLRRRGRRPHAVTRGYGGSLAGPLRIEAGHTAAQVGDEALLLARAAPTWVARDRVAGARQAVAAGADVIVLDDGFQNPALAKDLSLVVVDGAYGFGNGRLLPAGPLREPIEDGLARADAIVLVLPPLGERLAILPTTRLPVLRARLAPEPQAEGFAGVRVLAFAGIGRPEKFFATLAALRAQVVKAHAFADHHAYAPHEVMALVEEAQRLGAVPVTTAKDAVRLPIEARAMVQVLRVELEFETPAALEALLDRV